MRCNNTIIIFILPNLVRFIFDRHIKSDVYTYLFTILYRVYKIHEYILAHKKTQIYLYKFRSIQKINKRSIIALLQNINFFSFVFFFFFLYNFFCYLYLYIYLDIVRTSTCKFMVCVLILIPILITSFFFCLMEYGTTLIHTHSRICSPLRINTYSWNITFKVFLIVSRVGILFFLCI